MKVAKYPRHPFNDTQRKRSFVGIKHKREQEKFPLFAAEIAAAQRGVDTIMQERAENWTQRQIESRAKRAMEWIKARWMLKLLPDHERKAFEAYYQRTRYPMDPGYVRTVLRMFLDGRLLMFEGRVECQAHLDFLADRAERIRLMSDDELLSRMQNRYCSGAYLDELRAERARRQAATSALIGHSA
ncbi:hypothetical protein [Novosphingobium sp.]|uniref:hypothetical protein n=1 Tax=Novosphingobium sp. TaxID=1874826 RepID=UPI0031D91951